MRTVVIILSVVLIIGGFSWFTLDHLHDPRTQVVSAHKKQQALLALLGSDSHLTPVAHTTTWNTYQGKTIQFSYPGWARVYPSEAPTARNVIDQFLFETPPPKVHMAIEVLAYPTVSNVSDIPAVSYRLSQTGSYIQSQAALATHPGIAFMQETPSGVELSAFFLIGANAYSFVATGIEKKTVEEMFTSVLSSVALR